jgi:hypothetical protein
MPREEVISDAINNVLWSYGHGQYKYMNDFIKYDKSARDMLALGLFPNAKEITESSAALNAVLTKLKFYDRADPNIAVISVGDGRTPRTAALFAFRTKWQCISVDPQLNPAKIDYWEQNIDRLKCYPNNVEDLDLCFEKCIIVAVHSHADLHSTLRHIRGNVRSMVAIPCCILYNHELRPKEYRDAGIWRSI